jgi:hypothetical protein
LVEAGQLRVDAAGDSRLGPLLRDPVDWTA